MLGKVIRFEFRDTAKVMGLIYAVMTIMTIMGSIAIHGITFAEGGGKPKSSLWYIFCTFLFTFYVICIIVSCVLMFVYNCVHYFKSMYSAQGYLTHTLPVSTDSIFFAKFLTFFVWNFLTGLLAILSVFCMIYFGMGPTLFRIALASIEEVAATVSMAYGMDIRLLIIIYGLILFLGQIAGILFFLTSFAIGQLSNQHKIGASILAGFVIYVIMQIVSTVSTLFSGGFNMFSTLFTAEGPSDSMAFQFISRSLFQSFFISLAYCVILYLVTTYINNKQLNLE